jgi:hypothetical protein
MSNVLAGPATESRFGRQVVEPPTWSSSNANVHARRTPSLVGVPRGGNAQRADGYQLRDAAAVDGDREGEELAAVLTPRTRSVGVSSPALSPPSLGSILPHSTVSEIMLSGFELTATSNDA